MHISLDDLFTMQQILTTLLITTNHIKTTKVVEINILLEKIAQVQPDRNGGLPIN